MTGTSPYTTNFFQTNVNSSTPSAQPILELVRSVYPFDSIVDIGCGSGAWLATAESLGCTVLRGYDGPWADPAKYTSPNIDFVPVDMQEGGFEYDRTFDLSMSVEVAEHLTDDRSDFIVERLCAAAPVVLFGAAIPDQGGVHHVNEQPQSYWIGKFEALGYECFDVIRPTVWTQSDVRWWFRQNTVLFVRKGFDGVDRQRLHELQTAIWDLVHPDHYAAKVRELKRARGEVASARATAERKSEQVDRLRADLNKARARNRELKDTLSGRRPPLRQTRVKDLPQPVQNAASALWKRLPPKARNNIRGARTR